MGEHLSVREKMEMEERKRKCVRRRERKGREKKEEGAR